MTDATGEMLRKARKKVGLTLTALADEVGSSATALSELENGQRKTSISPEEIVSFSVALRDTRLALDYCDNCPVRQVVIPRKFAELNRIQKGAVIASVKTAEKSATAADKIRSMMSRMCDSRFTSDPEFPDFRDDVVLAILDLKRGLEILVTQMMDEGYVSPEDMRRLLQVQQRLCVAKGHHEE